MSNFVEDTVNGSSFSKTPNGFSAVRTFIITGVSGNPETKLKNAMEMGGIPQVGEPHPAVGAIQVINSTATPKDSQSGTIEVVCTYGIPEAGNQGGGGGDSEAIFEIGSSVIEGVSYTETAFSNKILKIGYTTPNKVVRPAIATRGFSVQIPTTVFRVSIKRPSITVERHAAEYVGTVNSDFFYQFTDPGLKYAVGTLLCTGIDGNTADGGESMNATYEFAYSGAGWDIPVFYIDPDTGLQPPDAQLQSRVNNKENIGGKLVSWYPSKDFYKLGLLQ